MNKGILLGGIGKGQFVLEELFLKWGGMVGLFFPPPFFSRENIFLEIHLIFWGHQTWQNFTTTTTN
jgi:hypothetical protein